MNARRICQSCLVFFAVFSAFLSSAVERATFYVSPTGDDHASGTVNAPVRSLARARDLARPLGGARIVLANGMYETDEPLVFTNVDKNLVFEAAPDAKPVISAGRRITNWKVDANGWWRAPIEKGTVFAQFYANGQRRTRPFLPRKSYYYVAGAGGKEPETGRERFFCRADDFPKGENPGLEVCLFHTWAMSRSTVAAYNAEKRLVTLDVESFTPDYAAVNNERWYRFDNVRTALGEPGDWYLDSAAGEVIYVPLPGEKPETCVTVVSRHRHAAYFDGAEDILFRGVIFAYSDYGVQKGGNYIAQAAANQPGAVHAENAKGIRLENCAVMHTGAYGAVFTRGSENCALEGCELVDLGAGGVRIGDGWEKRPIVLSKSCVVRDCIIEGGGRVDPAGVGVWIGHGAGNLISHNTIHDLYYSGISAGWNWCIATTARDNILEWNHIYDIGQHVLSDMGGIYLLGSQPGTVERYNHVHHVTRARNCAFGIYFDSGTAYVTVTNNVVHDCQDCNWFCARISASNRVENNIFAYSPTSQLFNPPRSEESKPSLFARNVVVWEDARLIAAQPDERTMIYRDNLAWCDEESRSGNVRGFTFRDPDFLNPRARDFRLRDPTTVSSIGFVPFSIEGCGRISPRRFTDANAKTPAVFFPPPERENLPIAEDFENVESGGSWPNWNMHPKNAAEYIKVTDATAAQGRKSLEITDGIASWMPHLYHYMLRNHQGIQRITFALRLEPGAQPEFEVREEDGIWQSAYGPEIRIGSDGFLYARGKKLLKVPYNEWFRVELAFELGTKRESHTFTVSVTLPGDKEVRIFEGNPLHRRFRTVHWLGFQSLTSGGVKYWVDDFKLIP
ncbi:MAG: right-handed parallel beta-helix repeat-containing protein [Kiritimatiellae bacterium]|nr:right-handed parallel beta-helix repeat-containing protein [Kiritimatiellia bacterium]